MDRKTKEYFKGLRYILGTYGVMGKNKDALLDDILEPITDHVSDEVTGYCRQLAIDALALTLKKFGFGPKRLRPIIRAYQEMLDELDLLAENETIDNLRYGNIEENGKTDIPHLKAEMDKALQPLYGEDFLPYGERYKRAQLSSVHHSWDELRKMANQ